MLQRSAALSRLIVMVGLVTSSACLAFFGSNLVHRAASDVHAGVNDVAKQTGLSDSSSGSGSNLIERQSSSIAGARVIGQAAGVVSAMPFGGVPAADIALLSGSASADNSTSTVFNDCLHNQAQMETCETIVGGHISVCNGATSSVKQDMNQKIRGCFHAAHAVSQHIGGNIPNSQTCYHFFNQMQRGMSTQSITYLVDQITFADSVADELEIIAQAHSANPNLLCTALSAKICAEAMLKSTCSLFSAVQDLLPGIGKNAAGCCAACLDNEACKEGLHKVFDQILDQLLEVMELS